MIRMGIIGFGFMGHEHARMLEQFEEIRLVCVCDVCPEQLADAPEGVETYTSAEDMLEHSDVDTVIISAPNTFHLPLTLMCAAAGKNIICEKPAAMSVAEFDRMAEAAREAGVHLTVHQQRRWDVDYQTMKAVCDRKLLGEVYLIKSQLYGFNGNMHDWHVYPELGGGMLYDWGVHLIDQILQMVDSRPLTVYATMKNVINANVDDYFKIIFEYENGVPAEKIAFKLNGKDFLLAELAECFKEYWFVRDPATIFVRQDGGITPGAHSLRVYMKHRVPYTGYFGQYLVLDSDVAETRTAV